MVELGEALDTLAKNPSKLSPLAKANAKFANVLENNIVKNDLEIFEKLVVLSKLSFDRVMESPEEKKVGERAVELLGSVGKMIYAANEPFEDVVRRPNTNNYYNYKNIGKKGLAWLAWGLNQIGKDINATLIPVDLNRRNVKMVIPTATPFVGEASIRSSAINKSVRMISAHLEDQSKKDLSSRQKEILDAAIANVARNLEGVEPTRYRAANKVAKWVILGFGVYFVLNPVEMWTGWTLTADSPMINSAVWALLFASFYRARNVATGSKALKYYDAIKRLAQERVGYSCKRDAF